MGRQKFVFQTKEKDKTPEEQLSEVELGNLPLKKKKKKSPQSNGSKDDLKSQEKNGGPV